MKYKIQRLAKDFFMRLCNFKPDARYTAKEALNHPWITRKFETLIPLSHSEIEDNKYATCKLITAARTMLFLMQFPSVIQYIDMKEHNFNNSSVKYSKIKKPLHRILTAQNSFTESKNKQISTICTSPNSIHSKKALNKSINTPQNLKSCKIDFALLSSRNADKYKLAENSKESTGIKHNRVPTSSSFGSSVERQTTLSPIIFSSKVVRKTTGSVGPIKLSPMEKSEKLLTKSNSIVLHKTPGSNKEKSKFGPAALVNLNPEMMKTQVCSFIKKLFNDNEKPAIKLQGVKSHKKLSIDQRAIIINSPNRLIIK